MRLVRFASSSIIVSLLASVVLLFLPGCGKTSINNPVQIISPTSGSSQSAPINTAFAAP